MALDTSSGWAWLGSSRTFISSLSPVFWWILNSVVVVIVATFAATRFADWQRERISVVLITPRRQRLISQFVELYEDIIPFEDQVAPERILRLLDDQLRSPRSVRGIKLAIRKHSHSNVHLLLVARKGSSCVGFIKAIICGEGRVLFLAYLGTTVAEATPLLIGHLYKLTSRAAGKSIAFFTFEVAEGEGNKAMAKMRRFESYARQNGLSTQRIEHYLLPEMEFVDDRMSNENVGTLCIATFNDRPGADNSEVFKLVVASVYRDIYGETFDDNPDLHRKYLEYLQVVEELVSERLQSSASG